MIDALTLCIWADFQVCQPGHDVIFSLRILQVHSFAALIHHAVLDEPEKVKSPRMEQTSAFLLCCDLCVRACVLNPPYFAQVGSLLRITWFPTTISRDRALVTATLNLCRGPVHEGQETRNYLTNDISNVFLPHKCKNFNRPFHLRGTRCWSLCPAWRSRCCCGRWRSWWSSVPVPETPPQAPPEEEEKYDVNVSKWSCVTYRAGITLSSVRSPHCFRVRSDFRAWRIFSTCCRREKDEIPFRSHLGKNTNHPHSLVSCRGRWCRCPWRAVWGGLSFLASQTAWWGIWPERRSQLRWRKTDCWPLSHPCPSPRGRSEGNPDVMRERAYECIIIYNSAASFHHKPSLGDLPSCSRPRAPTGQQTPSAHCDRTARWEFSGSQHVTWRRFGVV